MSKPTLKKPKLSSFQIKLSHDEGLDFLSEGRWIIQRSKGHRAGSDDQILAWRLYQSWTQSTAPKVLELGAGKFTISLILSALWPQAQFVGIEAFEESYELAKKNIKLNQVEQRLFPILGDLREAEVLQSALNLNELEEGFDLICGAPPFMPIGSGVMPKDPQRTSGRFELKGGVEAYLKAMGHCLAARSSSRAYLLMDGANHGRTLKAIEQEKSLKLIEWIEISPRPNAAIIYEVFELASAQIFNDGHTLSPRQAAFCLSQRASTGEQWSTAYQQLRVQLGLQPPSLPWVFVPARLGSTRLPEKALIDLNGQAMIARVCNHLGELIPFERLVVTSDSPKVLEAVQSHTHPSYRPRCILTDSNCDSGSQRVLQAFKSIEALVDSDWLINVQGDEPLLPLESLEALFESLVHFWRAGIGIVTLAAPLPESTQEQPELYQQALNTSSTVKVCLAEYRHHLAVQSHDSEVLSWSKALYFTRQPTGTHQHIGVYAFHRSQLHLLKLPRGRLAQQENLEQLTWLENGAEIGVVCLKQTHPPGVDTYDDLVKVRTILNQLTGSVKLEP